MADAERPAQDAHVGVHAHQHDVFDVFLHEEVVDFLAAVADAVVADDVEAGVLLAEAAHRQADDRIIARLFRGVHRQRRFAFGVELAPAFERHRRLGGLCLLHAQAVRRAGIQIQRAAWGMDDHDAVAARRGDHLVHLRRHDADALGGELAVVIVPHVADNDRRLARLPIDLALGNFDFAARRRLLAAFAERQPQRAGEFRAVDDRFILFFLRQGGATQRNPKDGANGQQDSAAHGTAPARKNVAA